MKLEFPRRARAACESFEGTLNDVVKNKGVNIK